MKKLSILLCLILALQLLMVSCGTTPKDPADSSAGGQGESDVSSAESDSPSENTTTTEGTADKTTGSTLSDGTTQGGDSTSKTQTPTSEQSATPDKSSATQKTSSSRRTVTTTAYSATKVTTTTTAAIQQVEDTALAKLINPYLNTQPHVTKVTEYNPKSSAWSSIEAITYDGATIEGKKTKVFAYIGFPKGASANKKVPAVVLVHGGGGHAYAEWVKVWNDRGYAAIAMDTTGYFPSASGKGLAGSEDDSKGYWQYGLYGPFIESGYVNTPNSGMEYVPNQELEEMWMYHAVVSTIMAHNILKADTRVDTAKIGITGISWGGVITSLAIGYDTRYAYAIPVYGCGYLDESMTYFYDLFSTPKAKELWSAASRFHKVKMPTLWLALVHDAAFSINTNTRSYLAVKDAGGIIGIKQNWGHSHRKGWAPTEIYRFADSICGKSEGLVSCVTEPSGRNISFTIKKPADATSVTARAYYITEKLSYSVKNGATRPSADQPSGVWRSVTCTVNGTKVTGTLPAEAVNYYVEITATTPSGSFSTSTGLIEK